MKPWNSTRQLKKDEKKEIYMKKEPKEGNTQSAENDVSVTRLYPVVCIDCENFKNAANDFIVVSKHMECEYVLLRLCCIFEHAFNIIFFDTMLHKTTLKYKTKKAAYELRAKILPFGSKTIASMYYQVHTILYPPKYRNLYWIVV